MPVAERFPARHCWARFDFIDRDQARMSPDFLKWELPSGNARENFMSKPRNRIVPVAPLFGF
jgi:hypothetical protein